MTREARGCFLQFAKAPVPGAVKTRLQPLLGADAAAAVAARMIEAVSDALAAAAPHGWESILCADDPEHLHLRDHSQRKNRRLWAQGEGDLGQRMGRACARALSSFPAVILVGSDCLGYDRGYLRSATLMLEQGASAVLGPEVDGGYVLLGLRQSPEGLFEGIPWGEACVAELQRTRLRALGLRWKELPPRADVDRPQDLWMLGHLHA